jgi:hypothetical protein
MTDAPRAQSQRPSWLFRLKEFYGLNEAASAARLNSHKQTDPGYAEFVLACATLADARELEDSAMSTTALLLYGDGAALLLRVLSLRAGAGQSDGEPVDDYTRFLSSDFGAAALARLTGEQLSVTAEFLRARQREPLILRLSPARCQVALAGLRSLAFDIARQIARETLPLRKLRRTSVARIVLTLVALAAIVRGAWYLADRSPNLALGTSVTLSSSSEGYGVTPDHLVDGNRSSLGFHTDTGPDQFATIDLGKPTSIQRVHVYNRTDCCPERAIPLRIELSLDGTQYDRVAHRERPFLVWKATFKGSAARFVRVTHEGDGYFHLSEVEVY